MIQVDVTHLQLPGQQLSDHKYCTMRRVWILNSTSLPEHSLPVIKLVNKLQTTMAIESSPEVFNSLLSKLGAPTCYEVGILELCKARINH